MHCIGRGDDIIQPHNLKKGLFLFLNLIPFKKNKQTNKHLHPPSLIKKPQIGLYRL